MKAILVVEMPDNCAECPYRFNGQSWRCGLTMTKQGKRTPKRLCFNSKEKNNEYLYKARKEWCPLSHPLKRVGHDYYIYDRKYLLDNLDRETEMLKKAKEYESSIGD